MYWPNHCGYRTCPAFSGSSLKVPSVWSNYILNSTEQTSWDGDSCSASQKIPCLLWDLRVHYHVRKDIIWDSHTTNDQKETFVFICFLWYHYMFQPFSWVIFRRTWILFSFWIVSLINTNSYCVSMLILYWQLYFNFKMWFKYS
jgi:hypothetical protein